MVIIISISIMDSHKIDEIDTSSTKWKNYDKWLQFVKDNKANLRDVPTRLRTEELCKVAVSMKVSAIVHVPENIMNEEICKVTVSNHKLGLQYVPKNLQTYDICITALRYDINNIRYVIDDDLKRYLQHKIDMDELYNDILTKSAVL